MKIEPTYREKYASILRILSLLNYKISIEVTPEDVKGSPHAFKNLKNGTKIFISHLAKDSIVDSYEAAEHISKYNLEIVPHITVRRYEDFDDIHKTIENFRNISPIKSIFLLAGDDDQATGIIEDTIQVLKSDFAESIRVDKIWISAYPDGHSAISEGSLYSALAEKIDLIRQKNIKSGVITQITFDIKKFAQWRKNLRDLKVLTDIRASCFFKTRKSYFLGLAKLIQSNSMQDYIDTFETSFADEWLTYEEQIGEILFDLQKYSDTVNGLHFLSLGQLDYLTKTIKVLFDDSVN